MKKPEACELRNPELMVTKSVLTLTQLKNTASLLQSHFRLKIKSDFLHHILYSKTQKTSKHLILSHSDLRLYVQNRLMEENQLIYFPSLLCLADQSCSFLVTSWLEGPS